MEIKNNNKVIVTGRHIMVVGAVISLLCCAYWFYRAWFCQEDEWLNVALTGIVGAGLVFFARKHR